MTNALGVAYCQPGVAAFFNFEIADEPSLAGWQSDLLWTDGTPKPSYQPFKDAVRRLARRSVDCDRYAQARFSGAPTGPRPAVLANRISAVIVRSLAKAEAFTTTDGSTIRELLGLSTAPVRSQSLAEAALEPGQATERHYHAETEEIYYIVEGSGEMELDGDRRVLSPGDAVLIPPGAWHQIRAGGARLRFLCCCAPAYRDEDTFFE